MDNTNTILSLKGLAVGYKSKIVLRDLDLKLTKGKVTALLGPNGSGKSTLLRTIASIQSPISGDIELEETPLDTFNRKELAKKLSLVLTNAEAPGNLTVFSLVALGRFPYTSWMGQLKEQDNHAVYKALEQTGLLSFANIHIGELSDGERQKVMIARALVQDTPLIFLDEPTTHLDSPNRIEVFHLLREFAHTFGKTILVTTHEIDLALQYADSLWLINHKQSATLGLPEDLVLDGSLEKAFGREQMSFDYMKGSFTKGNSNQRNTINVKGEEPLKRWTEIALEKAEGALAKKEIYVSGEIGNARWTIPEDNIEFKSLKDLISYLPKHNYEEN